MATDVFAPLTSLHRPDAVDQQLLRTTQRLASPAGKFSTRQNAIQPVGIHPLHCLFFSVEEEEIFRTWYLSHLGALVPFWVPSYMQDMWPTDIIADDATEFDIYHIRYTEDYFPTDNRKSIAFVRTNGSMLKRQIEDAEDNGDGTEHITINEALGEEWTPTNSNGICFLWYGRLNDDKASIHWITHDESQVDLAIKELPDPPLGGSGEAGPVDGSFED